MLVSILTLFQEKKQHGNSNYKPILFFSHFKLEELVNS